MMKLVLLLFVFCTQTFAEEPKEVAVKFMTSLKTELKKGMSKGAENGLLHCNDKAMPVTKSFNSKKYAVGRTSLKLRNESNKPNKKLEKLLISYNSSTAKNKMPPQVLRLESGKNLFVKPMYMKGMCLQCHGQNISKAVKSKLNKLYPKDKATGYKAGEFRGLVWVREK